MKQYKRYSQDLKLWWDKRPLIYDAYSVQSMRNVVYSLLIGGNYRTITEKSVREELYIIYTWLLKIVFEAKKQWGNNWVEELLTFLKSNRMGKDELKLLNFFKYWLLGLTEKTSRNLGLSYSNANRTDLIKFLNEMLKQCDELAGSSPWKPSEIGIDLKNLKDSSTQSLNMQESLWFMQMVGSSTLSIRGSDKSTYGKNLEKVFLKACFELLGLIENEDYQLKELGADDEVSREIDGEVVTKRGRVRIDITLIGSGNQEIGHDKLDRVGEHGILIVDHIGPKASVFESAKQKKVELIVIRHTFPLTAMYNHLSKFTKKDLNKPPECSTDILKIVNGLPDDIFKINFKKSALPNETTPSTP